MLAWAQRQAEQACAEIAKAEQKSEQAEAQHEKSGATTPFQDPAAAARKQAQATLDDAKRQVKEAGATAARALDKATELAPPQPGLLTMLGQGAEDIFQNTMETVGDFWRGSFEGTLGMAQQVRQLNPFDPYNMMHPQQYGENISNLASSTVAAGKAFINDPIGTGKAMIGAGIDGFTKDPAGFLGKMAPELAVGLASGGGSAAGSLSRRALDGITDVAGDMGKTGARQLDEVPHPNAPPWAQPDWEPNRSPANDQWSQPPVDEGQRFGPQGSDWTPEPEPRADPAPEQHAPEPESQPEPEPDPGPRELDAEAKAQLDFIEYEKENLSQRLDEGPSPTERERLISQMNELRAKEARILARFGQ